MYKIKNNLYISDIISFAQYEIDDIFVTVIGEHHQQTSSPITHNTLPLYQFIYETLKLNKNTQLLLEYSPDASLEEVSYNSDNMNKLKDVLISTSLTEQVQGIDVRRIYINNELLYTFHVNEITISQFLQEFYEPVNDVFKYIDLSPYSTKNRAFLKAYFDTKYNNYLWFYQNVMPLLLEHLNNKVIEYNNELSVLQQHNITLVEFFRKLWSDICDLYILTIILHNDNIGKRYIILIGEMHAKNFYESFKQQTTLLALTDNLNKFVNIKGATV